MAPTAPGRSTLCHDSPSVVCHARASGPSMDVPVRTTPLPSLASEGRISSRSRPGTSGTLDQPPQAPPGPASWSPTGTASIAMPRVASSRRVGLIMVRGMVHAWFRQRSSRSMTAAATPSGYAWRRGWEFEPTRLSSNGFQGRARASAGVRQVGFHTQDDRSGRASGRHRAGVMLPDMLPSQPSRHSPTVSRQPRT